MSRFEEKLLTDIEKALGEIKASGASAIARDRLSPELRAFVRMSFGTVPEKFSVQFLENIREILSKKLSENLTGLTEASGKNKALSSSDTARQTRQKVSDLLAGLSEGDLNSLLSDLKEKFGIDRPIIGAGILALFVKQSQEQDAFFTFEDIKPELEHMVKILTASATPGTLDTIKYKLFGSGKVARKLQSVIFDRHPEIENAFRLKDSVYKYIEAKVLDLAKLQGLAVDTFTLQSVREFLEKFEKPKHHAKYRDFIVSVMQGERDSEYIVIDWMDLFSYNPPLAKMLIDEPEEVLDAFEQAISDIQDELVMFSDGSLVKVPLEVHVTNIPVVLRPRDIRKEHVGKLVAVRGIISSSTNPAVFFRRSVFVCRDCGWKKEVLQDPTTPMFKVTKCESCGSRNIEHSIEESEKVDIQHITIQDSPEDINGGQGKKLKGYIMGAQVGSVEVGQKVILYGIIKPWRDFSGKKLAETNLLIEVVHVEHLDGTGEIDLTPDDIKEIQGLKETYGDELPQVVAESIAPWIVAPKEVKLALALATVSAHGLWDKRTSIHVLLIGDPGVAKTDLMMDLQKIAPKFVLAEGGRSSGPGLTASVRRDEYSGEWVVYGGALVIGSGGVVGIDEFANMDKNTMDQLKMAMEQGIIPVNLASVSGVVLKADSTIVATANPKKGHFLRDKPILEQLEIPSPVLSRFDLMFALLDNAEERTDREIIRSMLSQAKNSPAESSKERKIPAETLKRLFVYAKNRVFPKFTLEAERRIEEEFVKIRQISQGEKRPPVSRRFGDALIRLSYAHAKLRLSDVVEEKDVIQALKILLNMINAVAVDESGNIDYRLIEAGVTSKTADLLDKVKFVISKYENRTEYGAPFGEVLEELRSAWGIPEERVVELIDKLKRDFVAYEPRSGFLKLYDSRA